MELSQKILQYMQDKGVTAYKISKATGISESLFSMWKKKPTSKVSVKNLEAIAEYFGITVDELIGKKNHSAQEIIAKTLAKKVVDHPEGNDEEHNIVINVGAEANHQKVAELLGMISKKPSAKKDMDDVLTYLEFIAKRGE